MAPLNYEPINDYVVASVLKPFYATRLQALGALRLKDGTDPIPILKRKNPYLFKAKNIGTAEEFVRSALDAFLSSQEETLFGKLMEGLAVFVCNLVYGGKKPQAGKWPSLDLIFERDNKLYIVGIKSGPYWGNSDQIARMRTNFKIARETLIAEGETRKIIAVNGCMYGRESVSYKIYKPDPEQNYYKLCGQAFWELISGDNDLYIELIKPIDEEAKKRDEQFKELYTKRLNEMAQEFSLSFIKHGQIDWEGLLKFVSKAS
jgi:site-specific DNA-methyltransferase (cytosine-N4-specific)